MLYVPGPQWLGLYYAYINGMQSSYLKKAEGGGGGLKNIFFALYHLLSCQRPYYENMLEQVEVFFCYYFILELSAQKFIRMDTGQMPCLFSF